MTFQFPKEDGGTVAFLAEALWILMGKLALRFLGLIQHPFLDCISYGMILAYHPTIVPNQLFASCLQGWQ